MSGNTNPDIKEVLPSKELEARLSEYLVVDVREPNERVEIGFVPTSINIPLGGFVDGTSKLPASDKPVLVICGGGNRSLKAAQLILASGDKRDITNLWTGTRGWISDGFGVDHPQ